MVYFFCCYRLSVNKDYHIFGRAAITLGIGPHSSLCYFIKHNWGKTPEFNKMHVCWFNCFPVSWIQIFFNHATFDGCCYARIAYARVRSRNGQYVYFLPSIICAIISPTLYLMRLSASEKYTNRMLIVINYYSMANHFNSGLRRALGPACVPVSLP